MAMTKRHYVEVAAIFKRKLSEPYPQDERRTALLKDIAKELADMFKRDNGNFQRDKFLDACGFTDP
ncbi:hypothetical protein [Rhizobium phage RHph_X3_9]|nr:hypothetical protein [Rhizobium phage RHph_X3_9]